MIGIIQVKVSAHSPNMPLCPCFAFKDSPSSLRILDVPKTIGAWRITEVFAMFHYPDDVVKTKSAVREGNVWVATVEGCSTSGKVTNGLTIAANGIDEDGNAVNGYVLGIGDIYVMNRDDSIAPDPSTDKFYVRYCDSQPSNPTKGDAYVQGYMLNIYNGTTWVPACDISAVEAEIDAKRDYFDLSLNQNPRVTHGDITFKHGNDEYVFEYDATNNYWGGNIPNGWTWLQYDEHIFWITNIQNTVEFNLAAPNYQTTVELDGIEYEVRSIDDSLAKTSEVPTKTSDLTNDSGFITSAQVPTPDKIQDTSGNVINADRTVGYNLQVNAAWKMVNSLTHQQFVLTSDNGTTFSYSDPEPYTVDSWKAEMSWLEDSSAWEFITYQWDDGELEWESVDDVYFYFTTQDQTDMENDFWHGTRPVATTGELALKSYVDGQIGQVLTEAF